VENDYDYHQDKAQNFPEKYVVELQEAKQDQIESTIKSVNISSTSIYDFQGNFFRFNVVKLHLKVGKTLKQNCLSSQKTVPLG
jgi:hypothetical protein